MKATKLFILLVFTGFNHIGFSQVKLDSLLSVWNNKSQPDSNRAKAYKEYISGGFLYSNPDTANSMADDLIAFGKKTNYAKGQVFGLNIKGSTYYLKGEYPQALNYYTQTQRLSEQIGYDKGVGNALNNIGNIYWNQGQFLKALSCFSQSLKKCELRGDQQGMAIALGNLGLVYFEQKDYQKAQEYFEQNLKISAKLGNQKVMANMLNNIGSIYVAQGDYVNALDYCFQALKINEQMDDQQGKISALNNIGATYLAKGDYANALDYFTQVLKVTELNKDPRGMAISLSNVGEIHSLRGDYSKAIDNCQKGYKLAISIGIFKEQRKNCKCLYDAYKAMGKGTDALVYLENLRVVEDSLNAQETSKKLQQMEFAKQVYADSLAQVEKERLVQEAHEDEVAKKNKTRNMLAGAGIIVFLVAGGLFSRNRYIKKSKDIIEGERDRSDNLLLNILPAEIAAELKANGEAAAKDFDLVSILFTDFKEFTQTSEKLGAVALVAEINHCFKAFDAICGKYDVEKIKTIGDAYMAAGGLPVPTDNSVRNAVLAALEMQDFIVTRKAAKDAKGEPAFEMRVGIHTGPVVAGIVGVKKFQYDIWGDTVNTASRMESAGEVGKVNISRATFELIQNEQQFEFEYRGKIEAKGKGAVDMYFVTVKNDG